MEEIMKKIVLCVALIVGMTGLVSCNNASSVDDTSISENLTGIYTVNFYRNYTLSDTEVLFSIEFNGGDSLKIPSRPKRDGYYFRGWCVDRWCEIPVGDTIVSSDMDLYARWEAKEITSSSETSSETSSEQIEYEYALKVGSTITALTINPGNASGTEYWLGTDGIYLEKGVSVSIIDADGSSHDAIKDSSSTFATWSTPLEGYYNFYYDSNNDNTYIQVPTDPNAGIIDLYFNNSASWSQVYYYAWNTGSEMTWPGVKLTEQVTTNIYHLEIDTSVYSGIIFNNGSNSQTGDIYLNGVETGTMFDASGNKSTYSA
jgi:uncharacterized repeat protein (TIGR02543 family)